MQINTGYKSTSITAAKPLNPTVGAALQSTVSARTGVKAQNTPFSVTDKITLSDAAQAVTSEQPIVSGGPYGSYTKTQLTQATHAISASQGLPDGKYDFNKLTGKQLNEIVNDMTYNKGVSYDDIKGLHMLSLFAQISVENGNVDQSRNVTSDLENGLKFAQSSGDKVNAQMWSASLDLVNSMKNEKYTINEANGKVKLALAAYRKSS